MNERKAARLAWASSRARTRPSSALPAPSARSSSWMLPIVQLHQVEPLEREVYIGTGRRQGVNRR
jgi:hypothetical protein